MNHALFNQVKRLFFKPNDHCFRKASLTFAKLIASLR